MKFTEDQIEQYYKIRLDMFRLRHSKGMQYRSICPFHGGTNPSQMLVHLDEGHFVCFSCGIKGPGIYQFEMELQKLALGHVPEAGDVMRAIEQAIGTPLTHRVYTEPLNSNAKGWDRTRARARYLYTDETGQEVFSVWRFVDREGKKITPPDRPCTCNPDADHDTACQNGRMWGVSGVRRVLYRLTDVVQSALVFVVEGEKNVDDLSKAMASYIRKNGGFQFGSMMIDRVGVTTNPGGASAWKTDFGYGKHFQSKVVIKLGDNDGPGRKHDEDCCKDVSQFAYKTFQLALPVGDGEDISDFLESNTITDFLKLLKDVVPYEAAGQKSSIVKSDSLSPRTLLVKPSDLRDPNLTGKDWLVEGLIERNTRGLIAGPPKTGKSLLFLDIALSLATNTSLFGMRPYGRQVKVAVVSREDGPDMVQERLYQLARGHMLPPSALDTHMLINTRQQSSSFKIDNPKDVREMADWLKMHEVEFCVIDVLNKIHGQQENSSDDMTKVMQQFDELNIMSGAQICVIHHTNKGGGIKGSTSIEGWADYVLNLQPDLDNPVIKHMEIKTKSSNTPRPKTFQFWQSDDMKISKINQVQS